MRKALEKQLKDVTWKEFLIKDLFEVKRGLSMYIKDKESFVYEQKKGDCTINLVQQVRVNNGITGYINKNKIPNKFKNKIEKPGQITINPDQPNSFYQKEPFIANSVIILDISNLTENVGLFILTELNKLRKNSTWSDKFPKHKVEQTKLKLPVKEDGTIDYEFMDTFIKHIKTLYIKETEEKHHQIKESYVQVIKTKTLELTYDEQKVLNQFENQNILWKEFLIKDLFKKIPTKKMTRSENGTLPATTATLSNNGLGAMVEKKKATILQHVLSATGNGQGKVFYQSKPFTVLQDSYALAYKTEVNKNIYLFLMVSLNKVYKNYDWNNKSTWNKIKEEKLKLPVKEDGSIDYEFMDTFIIAIQKIYINQLFDQLYQEETLLKQVSSN